MVHIMKPHSVKPRSRLVAVLGLAAALLAANGIPSPVKAQAVVLESSAATIKAGDRLGHTDTLTLPAGSRIRVVLPSGKTRTVSGPYSGTLADLEKGQGQNEGVMAWLRSILQTGGATEATPGATRSIRPPPRIRTAFSWSAIPVVEEGSVCIEKGAKIQLVRPPSSRADRVTVIDATSSERGEAQWESGSETAPWPANLAAIPDRTYHILMTDRPRRQITLRVVDRLPADADVLTELHRLGCRQQFEAWVREKLVSSGRGT
jgi:hypothetical protein